ncbi:MAG: hypothetical protein EP343_16465 [Deltaproteobacteria bacterium]|nr:MAG: hypothetical protein EP343_16465 [Deltaproteobacteria bacterium]
MSLSWSSHWDDRPQDADPWSSIVDLMSAFALVLFLAVTFFILNYNTADKKLKQKQKVLLEQQRLLETKEKQLNQSLLAIQSRDKRLLSSKRALALLQIKMAELKAQEKKLLNEKLALAALTQKQQADKAALAALLKKTKEKEAALATMITQQQSLLDKKRAKELALKTLVNKQQSLVERQKEETQKQKQFLSQASASRERCERQLRSLLEQKKKVLTAIYKIFSSRKEKNGAVGFDPNTGKFRLGGNILFSEGKSILTTGGKAQLRQVLQALDRVLLQPNVRPMVAGIMVEGHTNTRGRLERNWELSSQRALAAVQYLLSSVKSDRRRYGIYSKLLFAGAFGPFRPVTRSNGTVSQTRSRRIEIKVLFHNQKKLQGILQQLR